MKGKLYKVNEQWVVKYLSFEGIPIDINPEEKAIFVHPDDADDCSSWFEVGMDVEFKIGDFMGSEREFACIDTTSFTLSHLQCAIKEIIEKSIDFNESFDVDECLMNEVSESTASKILDLLKSHGYINKILSN